MGLFSRKKKEDITVQPPASSRVEVEIAKGATKQAAEKAKTANQHLNDLLVENGFTLKIYLAAGHQMPGSGKKHDRITDLYYLSFSDRCLWHGVHLQGALATDQAIQKTDQRC